jgi:hypothetical protein
MTMSKTRIFLILGVFIVAGLGVDSFAKELQSAVEDRGGLRISYLSHTDINIASGGINRIHFEKARITKIIGDTSKYKAVVADNNCDLFLTSSIPASGTIDLTLLLEAGKAIDLRLHVLDLLRPQLINIDVSDESRKRDVKNCEIKEMIEKMAANERGKYFVQKKDRKVEVAGHPDLTLTQVVSYRYGKLAGAGFTYKVKKSHRNNQNITEQVTLETFKGIFKDTVAIGMRNSGSAGDEPRVFVVYDYTEGNDV